jgi:hypothetical protein
MPSGRHVRGHPEQSQPQVSAESANRTVSFPLQRGHSGSSRRRLFPNHIYGNSVGMSTSVTVGNLPANGNIIYVRLWSLINGTRYSIDDQYQARWNDKDEGTRAGLPARVPELDRRRFGGHDNHVNTREALLSKAHHRLPLPKLAYCGALGGDALLVGCAVESNSVTDSYRAVLIGAEHGVWLASRRWASSWAMT